MTRSVLVMALLLLPSGCLFGEGVGSTATGGATDAPTAPSCFVAATAGGDGARGGQIALWASDAPALNGVLSAAGGAAGPSGLVTGGPAPDGASGGDAGSVALLEDAGWSFAEEPPPGSLVAVGVVGQADILPRGAAATIAVERLELGPNATLVLSRHPSIIVRELVIAEGGLLVLRDVGEPLATSDAAAADVAGLAGGAVTIVAESAAIAGAIDASGNEGSPGERGGLGGTVSLRAESLTVDGIIAADGGPGGAGRDERACDE